jgi:hypothetical protein
MSCSARGDPHERCDPTHVFSRKPFFVVCDASSVREFARRAGVGERWSASYSSYSRAKTSAVTSKKCRRG